MIGELIGGRYLVTGALGEGGMGVVYVAEQRMGTAVRKVAIKTLHQDLATDPSVVARFHRECSTVVLLEHPNTIKFYDFGATEDGTLYIAMEFVAGRLLSEVIEEGPLPPERVVNVMRQLCGALDEAHGLGIIHRDLKPDNVVLTQPAGEPDFVKLLDFGIAAHSAAGGARDRKLTAPGTVLGTPQYMSPEQFSGREVDPRSDIYSLGVMGYEMLTARLPFAAETPLAWAMQHLTIEPTPFEVSAPRNVPEAMRAAILRALSKNSDQRPSSAAEFLRELSAADAHRNRTIPMDSTPSSQAGPPLIDDVMPRKPAVSRRRRAGLALVAVVLPLIAIALFFALSPRRIRHPRDVSSANVPGSASPETILLAPAAATAGEATDLAALPSDTTSMPSQAPPFPSASSFRGKRGLATLASRLRKQESSPSSR
ncbi:MAG TPA: serine/threonine-protein kinase [Polyangiaceae bacterium]|jgi:serine/threonine-protein kinase|nr:serine/threonine-protein kinase [Polyangiaceae bacterium]